MKIGLRVSHGATNFKPIGPPTWRRDPRGGLTPVDEVNRGDVTLPCPNARCEQVLVRDADPDFLLQSWLVCPACDAMVSPHVVADDTVN